MTKCLLIMLLTIQICSAADTINTVVKTSLRRAKRRKKSPHQEKDCPWLLARCIKLGITNSNTYYYDMESYRKESETGIMDYWFRTGVFEPVDYLITTEERKREVFYKFKVDEMWSEREMWAMKFIIKFDNSSGPNIRMENEGPEGSSGLVVLPWQSLVLPSMRHSLLDQSEYSRETKQGTIIGISTDKLPIERPIEIALVIDFNTSGIESMPKFITFTKQEIAQLWIQRVENLKRAIIEKEDRSGLKDYPLVNETKKKLDKEVKHLLEPALQQFLHSDHLWRNRTHKQKLNELLEKLDY